MNPFKGKGLRSDDRPGEVEYIIDGFLAKEAITLYYAPPKNGKSVMAFALAKYVHDHAGMDVQYFDFDNGVAALEDRGIFDLIDGMKRLDYIHPEKVTVSSKEVLRELLRFARQPGKPLRGYLLIFDSATDFVNASDDNAAKQFMLDMKTLRNAGATVLILHHMNKSEKGYAGSLSFASASDNVFIHRNISESEIASVFTMEKDFGRFKDVRSTAFEVKRGTYDLSVIDYADAVIKPDEQAFIDKITKSLRKTPEGQGQSELLESIKLGKADKTAMGLLVKYTGRFWNVEQGSRNKKIYTAA